MTTPATTETLLQAPNLPLDKSESPAGASAPAGATTSSPSPALRPAIVASNQPNPLSEERPAATVRSNPLDQIHSFPRALAKAQGLKAEVMAVSNNTFDVAHELSKIIRFSGAHTIKAEVPVEQQRTIVADNQPNTAVKPEAKAVHDDPLETEASHYFSKEFAVKHGVPEAIVAKFLAHKVRRSKNYRDGKKWFYDTVRNLSSRYPYIKKTTMTDILARLKKKNLIEIDCFNRLTFDKTCWYTVPQQVSDAVESGVLMRLDLDVAETHGICAAVLIAHVRYELMEKPAKSQKPLADIYISMSPAVLARSIPYSAKTIKRTLRKLDGVIVKHPTRTLTYTLPQLMEGTNPTRVGTNPDMGQAVETGTDPTKQGTDPDSRGTNPNRNGTDPTKQGTYPYNNTHCKPLETFGSSVEKEPLQTLPSAAAALINSPPDDPMEVKVPVAHQPSQELSPSSTGMTGAAVNVKDYGEKSISKPTPTYYPEDDPKLSPAEKARLLHKALNNHNDTLDALGDRNACATEKFIFSRADLDTAEKLFELNRGFCVDQLTQLLYGCFQIPSTPGGFDAHFHARKHRKVGWFLKYIGKIAEELEMTEFNGWVALPASVKVKEGQEIAGAKEPMV